MACVYCINNLVWSGGTGFVDSRRREDEIPSEDTRGRYNIVPVCERDERASIRTTHREKWMGTGYDEVDAMAKDVRIVFNDADGAFNESLSY